MKRYISIIGCLFCLLAWNACTDDDIVKKGNEVKEGIPVALELSYDGAAVDQIQTRTDIGQQAESAVKDLYVLVFRKSGNDWVKETIQSFDTKSASSGSVKMANNSVTSGIKRIFGVGNVRALGTDFNLLATQLENVETIDDLNALVAEKSTVERLGGLLVSGSLVTGGAQPETGYCEINVPANGTSVTVSGKIELKRLDAKIKFDVYSADSVVFIPKSWRVERYPVSTKLMEQGTDATTTYGSTSDESFENYKKHTSGANREDFSGGDFTFYMFENHKTVQKNISYEDRERQEKEPDGHGNYTNGKFLNADENATYVVMTGDYKVYKADKTVQTSANVQYTVHLGNINLGNHNFDTDRNTSYTYKVTVVGVENIVTEVITDKEPQPGAEGDVVRSDQSFLFDAHYETKVVTFNKKNLTNLSVIVKTPYNNPAGTYELKNGAVTEDNFIDYEWVSFIKNGKSGNNTARSTFATYEPKDTIGIKTLLKELNDNKNAGTGNNDFWDKNGEAKYTIFINEYYYDDVPGTHQAASFKDFINADNRQMYILCNTQKSSDQASSLTTSSIMIDQRSIKTIYDLDHATSGWGVETVEENSPLKPSSYTNIQAETRTNGRYNFFKIAGLLDGGTKSWSNYINASNNSLVQTKLDYSCMSRNRDLNGDGKISADEIRWYLPATNQFTGLWLGRDALSPEVRLFQGNASTVTSSNRFGYHYFSSNLVRFWAEEGAATGSNDFSGSTNTASKVRCARNFGGEKYDRETPTVEVEPQDFVEATFNGDDKLIRISLSRVNSGALRSDKVTSQLVGAPEHSGASLNRPYKAFKVATKDIEGSYINRTALANGSYQSCGGVIDGETGWRVPNQRELSLIAGYLKEDLEHSIGSTTFSDLPYKTTNVYVSTHDKINYVHLNDSRFNWVRCVKDVD